MLTAIIVSFLAGVTVVVSRTTNARLAAETSLLKSTFYNYVIGLTCSLLVLFFLHLFISAQFSGLSLPLQPWSQLWIYLGGAMGVCTVSISNAVVTRISSFYVTLLMFVGQVFAGILLDVIISHTLSLGILLGGTCVAIGLVINLWIDKRQQAKKFISSRV
ncbi:EamA-like transporter family protein [Aminipila butyrica]|uniref:EamA-like transporter family protein n=1 Tax=Aminipila butyrica TaxID=433296 RepID=A0A858BYG2_9FIRM|nr:DMT family transporter [Aminipila butyrica]QIB70492.1 EamA-like transporter family protein [Aminipila butyrica]